jgi:predicted outer membrane repeat protein
MTIDNITYGDLTTPYLFFNNSTSNVGTGSGGGIYSNNSTVNLTNISIVNNHASGSGGAIYAATNSQINITRSSQKCWSDISCNFIQGNTANLVSGAFHFTSGSDGLIQASTIKLNRADIATVLNVGSATSSVRIESSFIYENGDFGNGLYNDDTVIRVNGAELILLQTTMVNNDAIDQVISAISGTSLKFLNSIIYNPTINAPFYNQGSGSFTRDCLFVDDANNNATSGVTPINQFNFSLLFIDPSNGDYHLDSNSLLIDKCSKINITGLDVVSDIDNQKYGFDFPAINGSGLTSYDVGADELNDVMFSNGFE